MMKEAKTRTWAPLVPELACRDFSVSLAFYRDILGFSVRYTREDPAFAYLDLGAVQLMLEQAGGHWSTGELSYPFGRGVNLQIEVEDVDVLYERVVRVSVPLFKDIQTSWYRDGDREHGQREFLVQDPDGYLLRFCQSLQTRLVVDG